MKQKEETVSKRNKRMRITQIILFYTFDNQILSE